MTNQGGDGSGPSLFQARSTHHHNHNHNHQHLHLHQHRRLHSPEADTTSPHIRSPPNEKLHDRQVVIVQTVSVVHYIDATGAVTSVETLSSDPAAPTTLDLSAVVTAGLSALSEVLPSVSLSGLLPVLTDGAPSTTSSAVSETSLTSSLSASSGTLTSTLSSSSSAFPTLTGVHNSSSTTVSSLFGNHTVGLFSNHTRTSTSYRSKLTSTSTSTSTESIGSFWTSTTDFNLPTVVAGGGDSGNADAATPSSAPAPVEPTRTPPPGLAPETRDAVVGGVVGSVAGVALVALVFLYLLKWRRQRGGRIMLLGDADSPRSRGISSGGPGSPGSGRDMGERAGAFAIPSALAKLTGKRAIDAPPAEPAAQEKGFYRVSGKKLISVLESGGDGYSDPHDSIGSVGSSYRQSNPFLDPPNSPLQLGSPMRPVSGVPIFRDGPQRTAVHEDGPLPPGHRPSAFPTMLRVPDPVGRSFASRDGSRGSASRFTEDT